MKATTRPPPPITTGWMDDLVVPCAGVYRDNNLRADISIEKLSTLKTAFDKSDKGTLTAGNSTPLTDGASAVLLASEDWAKTARASRPGVSDIMASTGAMISSRAMAC